MKANIFGYTIMKKTLPVLLVYFLISHATAIGQTISQKELIDKMHTAMGGVKTVKYRFWKQERMHGKMEISEQEGLRPHST